MSERLTATLLLRRNARYWRRAELSRVLHGSAGDRFMYACHRASSRAARDLAVLGRVEWDPQAAASLAIHWYERLERISKAMPLYRAIVAGKSFARDL